MSVQIPDFKIFQYVEMGFYVTVNNSVINDLYTHSTREHCRNKLADKEATRWIKNLLLLNCKSYSARYREPLGDYHKLYTSIFRVGKLITVEACPLLKYLECIEYNIEMSTIENGYFTDSIKFELSEQDRKDFALLQAFRVDLTKAIVSQLPTYQNAKWAEA